VNKVRKAIHGYLALRRSLGFKLVAHEIALREFAAFLAGKNRARITTALALEWATQHSQQPPYKWASRLSIVRGFARHWSATDPSTEIPPPNLLPYRPARARPYFYSDEEILKLLQAAKSLPSRHPLRPWTYHCFLDCWRSPAYAWVRHCTFESGISIGPKACSLFATRSLASPAWCLYTPRRAKFWLPTRSTETASLLWGQRHTFS